MVVATLAFSAVPLTIGLSNSSSNPVLSNVLIIGGETIVFIFALQSSLSKYNGEKFLTKRDKITLLRAFLKCYYWGNKMGKTNTELTKEETSSKNIHNYWNKYGMIIAVMIGSVYWLIFAQAIKFIDIVIASIIVELWIVLFVIIRYFDEKGEERKNGIKKRGFNSRSILVLFIFALLGVIYITLSYTGISQTFSYWGLLLVMICLILTGTVHERALNWAERMSPMFINWLMEKGIVIQHTKPKVRKKEDWKNRRIKDWEKIFNLLCLTIGNIFGISLTILGSIFWIFQGNNLDLSFASHSIEMLFEKGFLITNTVAWFICISGGCINAIGRWNFRGSNIETDTLDINGIYYLTPVLSLVWLLPFGLIQIQRWDYFIIGALIILATSMLISIEFKTRRLGFRWLIVSLWSTGLLVYFREKWIQWPWLADDTPWEWGLEAVDYYSLIVLSATIFILILSFRTTRLIERINKEGEQYTRMKHIIKNLHGYKEAYIKDDPLVTFLNELDQFNTKTIGKTLENFQKEIKERRTLKHGTPQHAEISKLELEFDLLHQSKRRGRYLAENLVLYIFALVTIMVTIGTRPATTSHWNALMIDALAFLFSSAICFMTTNLIDLRLYREQPTAELTQADARNQKAEQVIAIILATVISVSFVVLLYDKWMGIWFL